MQGKKLKFTTFSKKTNSNEYHLTELFNDTMNQEEFDSSSAYYDYKKFSRNFHTLLSQLSVKFDIIGITETRLKTHAIRTSNINLQGYSIEHTPTESTCGGSLLYINNDINYLKMTSKKKEKRT